MVFGFSYDKLLFIKGGIIISAEETVKEIIEKNYNSMKDFSNIIGVPYTTLISIFERDFINSNILNIVSIAKELNLDVEGLSEGSVIKKRN